MSAAGQAPSMLRACLSAIQFLTRIPVPVRDDLDAATAAADLRRGLIFLPVIGGAIGAVTGLVLAVVSFVLPFSVAVIIALAFEARLTGALHEDAVADVADAFGGGATQDEVLRILKDSRIGAYGAMALGLAIGLRAIGLIALADPLTAALVLAVSGAVGRWTILAVMALVPPVEGRTSLANDLSHSGLTRTALAGLLIAAPVLAVGLWFDPIAIAITAAGLVIFLVWYRALLIRRIGGVTGDCFGFAAYAGLLITLLAFCRQVG